MPVWLDLSLGHSKCREHYLCRIMTDTMARNVIVVVMMSIWHTVVTLVMFPTFLVKWLLGSAITQDPLRVKMSSNGQSEDGCVGGLTARDVELLESSWEKLGKDKSGNGVAFFLAFFETYPEAQQRFKDFRKISIDDLKKQGTENKKLLAHAKNVMYHLESYIDSLDDLECLTEMVRKIAISHKRRSIGVPQFKELTVVLLKVLESFVGEDEIEDTKLAWGKLMSVVCSIVEEVQRDE